MTVLIDASKPTPPTWLRGAHLADLETELSEPGNPRNGGRHPLPPLAKWCETLGRWGISPASHVVVYDRSEGGMAAARVWWMLRAVGHERVTVKDLSELSGELTDEVSPVHGGPPYPATAWVLPMVGMDEVERRRLDPTWRLVDARAAPRFRGEDEPIDPVAGHIPGAVNVPWQETVELEVARTRLAQALGDVPTERVIVHCGSGVTACHTLLQMHRLGMAGAALYVGSWSEWCRQ